MQPPVKATPLSSQGKRTLSQMEQILFPAMREHYRSMVASYPCVIMYKERFRYYDNALSSGEIGTIEHSL